MSTRLVVLSDTHMPRPKRQLPAQLVAALPSADLIVHLGDFTHMEMVSELRAFGPLVGVHGNNDSEEVQRLFPLVNRFEIGGYTVTLLHGHINGRTAKEAARNIKGGDLVLFGHSHQPFQSVEHGRTLFNPGSPTDRRWGPACSYGIVTLGSTVKAELVLIR